jgi:6-phosphogluconolactonase (cycloisomerase 2 family)
VHPAGTSLYAACSNGNVAQFSVNASTGALTAIGTGAIAAGMTPAALAVDPDGGNFLYVANAGSSTISVYSIDGAGALTFVGTEVPGATPTAIAITPDGSKLYCANGGGASISRFTVNEATGDLTAVGSSVTDTLPIALAIDSDGVALYCANQVSNSVTEYTINGDATLTSLGTITGDGNGPTSITTDLARNFVYVAYQTDTQLVSYTINDTTAAMVVTNPKPVRTRPSPQSVCLVHGTSSVAYSTDIMLCAASTDGALARFSVDQTDLVEPVDPLSPAQPDTPAGNNPNFVEVHALLDVAYVVNNSDAVSALQAYTIDGTGALALADTETTGAAGAWAFYIEPSLRFGYLVHNVSNTVTRFGVGASDGLLTPSGSSVSTGTGLPRYSAIDNTGQWLYVPNSGNPLASTDDLVQFSIDKTTGALTSVGTVDLPAAGGAAPTPRGLAVDPTGRFLYVAIRGAAGAGGDEISAYSIAASSGNLTSLGANVVTGVDPFDIYVHPAGRVLYVMGDNAANTSISTHQLSTTTGAVSPVVFGPVGGPQKTVRVAADGLMLFVTLATGGSMSVQQVKAFTLTSLGALQTEVDSDDVGVQPRGIGLRTRVD